MPPGNEPAPLCTIISVKINRPRVVTRVPRVLRCQHRHLNAVLMRMEKRNNRKRRNKVNEIKKRKKKNEWQRKKRKNVLRKLYPEIIEKPLLLLDSIKSSNRAKAPAAFVIKPKEPSSPERRILENRKREKSKNPLLLPQRDSNPLPTCPLIMGRTTSLRMRGPSLRPP